MYLGLDSSTQSLKGIVIDPASGTIAARAAVNFAADLPQTRWKNTPIRASGSPRSTCFAPDCGKPARHWAGWSASAARGNSTDRCI
jgi:hypothetical protein